MLVMITINAVMREFSIHLSLGRIEKAGMKGKCLFLATSYFLEVRHVKEHDEISPYSTVAGISHFFCVILRFPSRGILLTEACQHDQGQGSQYRFYWLAATWLPPATFNHWITTQSNQSISGSTLRLPSVHPMAQQVDQLFGT